MPARGLSLHIGVNEIDPSHYGTDGKLRGCENDARAMQGVAATLGYRSVMLLSREATTDNVRKGIIQAAERLQPGDIFMLTYAGHGAQVPDAGADEDEGDRRDETWCLYDRMLLDDELYNLWERFAPGVRVCVVSDSCHSGSVARFLAENATVISQILAPSRDVLNLIGVAEQPEYRTLDFAIAREVYQRNKPLYTGIQAATPPRERATIAASVILLAACQDNQTAADGAANGLFTATLLSVLKSGAQGAGYPAFLRAVSELMPPTQSPNFFRVGLPSPQFEAETPFSIAASRTTPGAERFPSTGGNRMPGLSGSTNGTSAQERLARLKRTHIERPEPFSRGFGIGMPIDDGCRFELVVPRSVIDGMSEQEVLQFLQGEGSDVLMTAYLNALSITTPRGVGGSIECKADTKGGAKCEGSISIRF